MTRTHGILKYFPKREKQPEISILSSNLLAAIESVLDERMAKQNYPQSLCELERLVERKPDEKYAVNYLLSRNIAAYVKSVFDLKMASKLLLFNSKIALIIYVSSNLEKFITSTYCIKELLIELPETKDLLIIYVSNNLQKFATSTSDIKELLKELPEIKDKLIIYVSNNLEKFVAYTSAIKELLAALPEVKDALTTYVSNDLDKFIPGTYEIEELLNALPELRVKVIDHIQNNLEKYISLYFDVERILKKLPELKSVLEQYIDANQERYYKTDLDRKNFDRIFGRGNQTAKAPRASSMFHHESSDNSGVMQYTYDSYCLAEIAIACAKSTDNRAVLFLRMGPESHTKEQLDQLVRNLRADGHLGEPNSVSTEDNSRRSNSP